MSNCVPCEKAKAKRLGLILAVKTSPGFAGGAWGIASQGDVVAVPRSLVEAQPDDFSEIVNDDETALADALIDDMQASEEAEAREDTRTPTLD